MHRRTRRTLWIVAAVLLLLAVAIFLRSKVPTEASRLLPESDAIRSVSLKPIQLATLLCSCAYLNDINWC